MIPEKNKGNDMPGRTTSGTTGSGTTGTGSTGMGSTGMAGSASRSSDDLRNQSQDVKAQAKEKAGEMADRAQQKTREMADQASSRADEQKQRAVSGLGGVQEALNQTSNSLREQNQDAMAGYVDMAAHQVERVSEYLSNRSVGDLMHDVERIARREPALFLGGAVLLGLVGARFFKSSSPDHFEDSRRYGPRAYERPMSYEQPYGRSRADYGRQPEPYGRSRSYGDPSYGRSYQRRPAGTSYPDSSYAEPAYAERMSAHEADRFGTSRGTYRDDDRTTGGSNLGSTTGGTTGGSNLGSTTGSNAGSTSGLADRRTNEGTTGTRTSDTFNQEANERRREG